MAVGLGGENEAVQFGRDHAAFDELLSECRFTAECFEKLSPFDSSKASAALNIAEYARDAANPW